MYDYVIIGGGIAGLYANYLLNNKYNTLLLEKNSYFGGRAKDIEWHSNIIKLGAGIVESQMKLKHGYEPISNVNLLGLIKKLKIPKVIFKSEKKTLESEFDMSHANTEIIKLYNKLKREKNNDIYILTFSQFLKKYFSDEFFKNYKKNSEDTDFFESDITYYIKYYDIKDNENKKYKGISIKWNDLIEKLTLNNCVNNFRVDSIIKKKDYFLINNIIKSKNIIFATTLKELQYFNNLLNIDYSKYIGSVPFFRIYAYYKNGYNMNKLPAPFTIVDNELQKIININEKILMVGYGDSKNANYWNSISKMSKKQQIRIIEDKLNELDLNLGKIDDIIIQYWETGVHYFKPIKNEKFRDILKKLSHPSNGIYIIGEMVSKKQGWVEGAVESVNRLKL